MQKAFQRPYQKVRKAYSQDTKSRAQIKGHKVQIGQGSNTAPGLIPIFH